MPELMMKTLAHRAKAEALIDKVREVASADERFALHRATFDYLEAKYRGNEKMFYDCEENELVYYKGEGVCFDDLFYEAAQDHLEDVTFGEILTAIIRPNYPESSRDPYPRTLVMQEEGEVATLADQPWLFPKFGYRYVDQDGTACYADHEPEVRDYNNGVGYWCHLIHRDQSYDGVVLTANYDASDWKNTLQKMPEGDAK